jgi:hypothetical protein
MAKRPARKSGEIYDPNVLLRKTRLLREEAAFLLEVTPRTVDRYMEQGKISFKLTPGGHRRPITDSVKKFM